VLPLANAHQEIVRLYVSVQVQARVDVLNSLDHLVSEHQHSFQREFAPTLSEQFLQTGSQHIYNQAIPLFVLPKPVNSGNPYSV
jgi:hypothetical protein